MALLEKTNKLSALRYYRAGAAVDATVPRLYDGGMDTGQPSRTALGAAGHRAAHQLLDGAAIFPDPLALPILGGDAAAVLREARTDDFSRKVRLFCALRSRVAEDALAIAVARGVRQLVVLGAGLDTFAYRSPFGSRLRIFEVDHPATQAWKREQLAAAGIPLPSALVFAPIDFECEALAEGLAAAGFDPSQGTLFTWLGVVPYLTDGAIMATLEFIAAVPGGAQVVFDYANPAASLSDAARAGREVLAARVAAAGEPFLSYFDTEALHRRLRQIGFRDIEDLGPKEIAARFFPHRESRAAERGGHVLRAATGHRLEPR
jgi:methyltransferase (TIGR00027 family)